MAHKVTAVVYEPTNGTTELVQCEVSMWYEALDMVIHEWSVAHPTMARERGVDDLEIRAISIMKVAD